MSAMGGQGPAASPISAGPGVEAEPDRPIGAGPAASGPIPSNAHKTTNPFEGLYGFARAHLLVINAVVLAASTMVGLLDFLAPRLSILPTVVYSATFLLVTLMVIAAFAPVLARRILRVVGLPLAERASVAVIWKNPQWQVAFAVLLAVTVLGFVSVAKASQGGVIASSAPMMRELQQSLLGLDRGVAGVRRGVDDANSKLDSIMAGSTDPRRQLVQLGYHTGEGGLMEALRQGDARAMALFAQVRTPIEAAGPIILLLYGKQPWNPEVAALIRKDMIVNPEEACRPGVYLASGVKPPISERIATFKRLCDARPALERTLKRIGELRARQALDDYDRADLEKQIEALPFLQN